MKKPFVMSLFLAAVLFLTFTEIHSQNSKQIVLKYNPLHKAILKGSKSLVKKYSKSRYFYYSDRNTHLPLELAFLQNRMDLAKIMVQRGLKVDNKDFFGETAVTVMVCDVKWLKFAVQSGANKNQISPNKGGQSLLHIAARCLQSESLKFLLNRKAYREVKDVNNETPLMLAVDNKKLKNADILVRAGAQMEYTVRGEKRWALKAAIRNHDPDMVKLLLDSLHRVRPYTDEIYKVMAGLESDKKKLDSVKNGEMIKIYRMLIKKRMSSKPVQNYTCAAAGSDLGRYWIDNEWKNRGWKLNAWRNQYGGSMLACVTEKKDIRWLVGKATYPESLVALYASRLDFNEMKYYIEKGHDVNGKDEMGRTSLFYAAAEKADPGLTKYLILKGINVNAMDNSGETVYSCVTNQKQINTAYVSLLLNGGFKVKMKNKKGDTAVDTAKKVCRRQLALPHDSVQLENCVDTLALLSGAPSETFIPSSCKKALRLSRHQEYQYIKKNDGYYKWQGGKLVKVILSDPCGKYRLDSSKGGASSEDPSKKRGSGD